MQELQILFTKFLYEIMGVAVVLLVALLVSQALKRLVNVLRDLKHVSPMIATRLHAVRRWVITLLTVLVVLEALGIFKGAWALLSTMLAALALGFVAAWSVLSNATAAMLILIFRPFRVGDEVELIEVTNGYPLGGRVRDMNLLYTTLEVAEDDDEDDSGQEPPVEGAAPRMRAPREAAPPDRSPRLVRVPNNMFFQRPVRTRSSYATGSKAPFFGHPR
ncbi:MAG: mechanosensitive ion channel [Burkholderiaceae bacterium]|nr:mechanosensitive ion channel [Rhodoferax sp.]MCB2006631.1 mechanosensitive ion channel [Rhodoferax sp.]MCB2029220.1 mechanosensitive ion channel [Rhodoferax sp.]MCB2039307.1 mechanosensitive ion channel [Rhodoferax sp.]MCW5628195.1 mechanosensitive ion channel [Rhodoferax sp.]